MKPKDILFDKHDDLSDFAKFSTSFDMKGFGMIRWTTAGYLKGVDFVNCEIFDK